MKPLDINTAQPVSVQPLPRANPALQSAEPVRVLLWHWGRRGGGPNYTHELAKALAENQHLKIHLSLSKQSECFYRTDSLGLPGFHVSTYQDIASCLIASSRLPALRRRFHQYLVSQKIDLVYCTMTHLWNLFMLGAIHKARIPYLLTVHDATLHPGEQIAVRHNLLGREIAKADGVITLTNYVKECCVRVHGYPQEKISVVPHGPFSHGQDLITPRRHPGDGPFNILFFGRILPYKGLDILIKAFAQIKDRHPKAKLSILGNGKIGVSRARLESLGVHIDNRWIPEEEMGSIFDNCHLLAAPYVEASQSGIIPLAYAKAVPVIATRVGGLCEQVDDGKTGLIVDEASPRALALGIGSLIDDPFLYQSLSNGALNYARAKIAWPNLAGMVAGVMEDITKER